MPAAALALSLGPACSVGVSAVGGSDAGALDSTTSDANEDAFSAADGSACQPGDVQTYVPGKYHPATPAWQGVCTTEQMQTFYAACLDTPDASTASCHAFSLDPGNAACAACILTPETASAYGPLVDHGSFITENVGGCIELADPSGLPCAKAQQALVGCQLAACEVNCPVHDVATRAAYDACAAVAAGAGCQAYASQAACGAQEGGPSAACVGQTFEAFYYNVVPTFCGAPPLRDAAAYDAGRRDATTGDASLPPDASWADAPEEGSTKDALVSDANADASGD